ncbi:cholinesterase-like, partial [Ceratina calcarata]
MVTHVREKAIINSRCHCRRMPVSLTQADENGVDSTERYTMFSFSILLSVATLLASVECQRMTEVVQTADGPVRGRIFETIWHSKPFSAFQGIPYGKPPVGPLRFKDPVKVDSWTEVLNATENFKYCPQYVVANYVGQEDCLYLNVFSPVVNFGNITKDYPKKPVMFWIYGGDFATGAALQDFYAPDFFLEDDVVFVSLNYRLDVLGFLALDLPGVKGNSGLKDQVLALKWVQRNIAAFGGDPNRVTIFGESAGSASVSFHLLSSQAEGLFHQAILESGTAICPWAYNTRNRIKASAFALA